MHSEEKNTAQLNDYYELIKLESLTMMEASVRLNILRANICRYQDHLRTIGKIFIVEYRTCRITKYPNVMALSANQGLKPKTNQLKLF